VRRTAIKLVLSILGFSLAAHYAVNEIPHTFFADTWLGGFFHAVVHVSADAIPVVLSVWALAWRPAVVALESFRAITDSTYDAIIMIDSRGDVVFWNNAAATTFGYTAQQILGKSLHSLIAPESLKPRHHAAFPEFQKTGKGSAVGRVLELVAKHSDGHEFPVELAVSPVRTGKKWSSVGVVRDVTARKAEQAALSNASKLASLGLLSAGIIHEINNPLCIIKGYVGMLLDGSSEAGVAGQKILEATNRITKLVDGVKHHVRSDGSALSQVSAVEFVQDFVDFCGPVYRKRVTLSVDTKSTRKFLGNQDKLSQVLLNLVSNACDALENTPGAQVTIRCWDGDSCGRAKPCVNNCMNKPKVFVSVSDNGPGISADTVPRLFETFFTTKPAGKGTGLGLSVSREIVQSVGGSIHVDSKVGAGATFTLCFPAIV
jgi:PAS domain S-box-containing protein